MIFPPLATPSLLLESFPPVVAAATAVGGCRGRRGCSRGEEQLEATAMLLLEPLLRKKAFSNQKCTYMKSSKQEVEQYFSLKYHWPAMVIFSGKC